MEDGRHGGGDIDRQGRVVGELSIDRAYINSALVAEVIAAGGEILGKPWAARNTHGDLFTKADFKIDMRSRTITCPAGQVEAFEPGEVVEFDPDQCGSCRLRSFFECGNIEVVNAGCHVFGARR